MYMQKTNVIQTMKERDASFGLGIEVNFKLVYTKMTVKCFNSPIFLYQTQLYYCMELPEDWSVGHLRPEFRGCANTRDTHVGCNYAKYLPNNARSTVDRKFIVQYDLIPRGSTPRKIHFN